MLINDFIVLIQEVSQFHRGFPGHYYEYPTNCNSLMQICIFYLHHLCFPLFYHFFSHHAVLTFVDYFHARILALIIGPLASFPHHYRQQQQHSKMSLKRLLISTIILSEPLREKESKSFQTAMFWGALQRGTMRHVATVRSPCSSEGQFCTVLDDSIVQSSS